MLHKIRFISLLGIALVSLHCSQTPHGVAQTTHPQDMPANDTIRLVNSVAQLQALPKGSIIEQCDLSGQAIPTQLQKQLKDYQIIHLKLENCQLTYLDAQELPQSLQTLNVSHNKLKEDLILEPELLPNLKVLNCSYNEINRLHITRTIVHLNAAHNKLRRLTLLNVYKHDERFPKYVNVAYNWNLHYALGFPVEEVDTLISYKAARGKKLVYGPLPDGFSFH